MNIQFFICFHKQIYHNIYKIKEDEQKYITFYGVKEKDSKNIDNVIYEYELSNYNPNLQRNKYNEGSCIYHVYSNKLYEKYDYVGICQYDMIFPETTFTSIQKSIENNPNTIFCAGFFQWAFLGGQTSIINDYYNISAGLKSYNKFFNKNYTEKDLITNRMIMCNIFLIPKKMYEKMMFWLKNYFIDDINTNMYDSKNNIFFNPGHMIEALTGMFLSLEISEGNRYVLLDLQHDSSVN
jgi:hypothetical protein